MSAAGHEPVDIDPLCPHGPDYQPAPALDCISDSDRWDDPKAVLFEREGVDDGAWIRAPVDVFQEVQR